MARHLERSAMKAEDVVPRIAAFAGLTVAGLMIPGGEPRQARGQAGMEKALGGFLYEDGGIASRSPVQALELLELLVTVRSFYSSRRLLPPPRSEEHTSELQSLIRISYAVFCLKKKNKQYVAPY